MAEKVLFSIKGLHSLIDDPTEEADEIEVINVADYYIKEKSHYIMYEEVMEGTDAPTKNLIKIKKDKVEIIKKGAVNTRMCFECGKSDEASYFTPQGQLTMGTDTKSIIVSEKDEEIVAFIEYAMKINYIAIADCKIELKIRRRLQKR